MHVNYHSLKSIGKPLKLSSKWFKYAHILTAFVVLCVLGDELQIIDTERFLYAATNKLSCSGTIFALFGFNIDEDVDVVLKQVNRRRLRASISAARTEIRMYISELEYELIGLNYN